MYNISHTTMGHHHASTIFWFGKHALTSTSRCQAKASTYAVAEEQSQLALYFHHGEVAMLDWSTFIHQHHIAFLNLTADTSLFRNLDQKALRWNFTKAQS